MEPINKLRLRLRLTTSEGIVIGPGRADLLAFIEQTGSIAAAGRQMKMSYKRAWTLVEAMNNSFTSPLVETSKGGSERGGARLTALGATLLAAYRELEAITLRDGAAQFARFAAALAPLPMTTPRQDQHPDA